MTLTAAQLAARKGKLTSSRIACLMTGDAVEIDRLYREMIGEAVPKDLSWEWPVYLGNMTEQGHLDWLERTDRMVISRRGDVVVHYAYDWAAVTLDGWIDEMQCPIEVKHVGGHEPWEIIEERYQPQLQWQMEVTGADQCAFSVIMGAREPAVQFIKRDIDYATEMIKRGRQFMRCIELRVPPVDLPAVPAPIDAKAVYDMSTNNEWSAHAQTWLDLRDSAEAYDEAAKILKSLVPADAKKCFGHGIKITRNKVGNLSLREGK